MMTKRFHITNDGPKECVASIQDCKVGAQSVGEKVEHFTDKKEAQAAYEKLMEADLFSKGASVKDLSVSELAKIAKITSNQDVMREALRRGTSRTVGAVAANPNADPELLAEAYENSTDQKIRRTLAVSKNFPSDALTDHNDYVSAVQKHYNDFEKMTEILNSDAVTDKHYSTFDSFGYGQPAYGLRNMIQNPANNPMLSNGNNKLSEMKLWDIASKDDRATAVILESGRFGTAHIKEMSAKQLPLSYISRTQNQRNIDGFADWAIARKDSADTYEQELAMQALSRAGNSESASFETFSKVEKTGLVDESLWVNPTVPAEIRERIAARNPKFARKVKLDQLGKQFPRGLKDAIVQQDSTNQPYRNRGYYKTEAQLDPVKVKELGLNVDDISQIMGTDRNFGTTSWDAETGVFTSTHDSTD